MLSLFQWRMVDVLAFAFACCFVTSLVLSLLLTYEVQDSPCNVTSAYVVWVQVSSYILLGLIGFGLLMTIIGYPLIRLVLRSSNNELKPVASLLDPNR